MAVEQGGGEFHEDFDILSIQRRGFSVGLDGLVLFAASMRATARAC